MFVWYIKHIMYLVLIKEYYNKNSKQFKNYIFIIIICIIQFNCLVAKSHYILLNLFKIFVYYIIYNQYTTNLYYNQVLS